ncbi:MAG: hypothetical protein Q9213_002172 [Squamulea squamosa]
MASGYGDFGSATTPGSNAAVLGALGTLIAYLGTEISVNDLFNRLLWPQKYYNNPSTQKIWKAALLMPMGGPLHKAALTTLDAIYKHGCSKAIGMAICSAQLFADTGRSYRLLEKDATSTTEHARNGMWLRVIEELPKLLTDNPSSKARPEEAVPLTKRIRQYIAVSHLFLERANKVAWPVVPEDTRPVDIKILGWLIVTDASGIADPFAVALVWRSAFMLLWLIPVCLKLLSACFPVPRESLATTASPSPTLDRARFAKFEIITNGNGFQIIEGEESLVLQFFRHYGHPIRAHGRELLQIYIVIALGLLLPLGPLCSLLWMPVGMQVLWLSYQLYTIVVLHIYHFTGGHHWVSTEENICQALRAAEAKHEEACVVFGTNKKTAIQATRVRTSHDSFAAGQAHVTRLLTDFKCEKSGGHETSLSLSTASSVSSSPDMVLMTKTSSGQRTATDAVS